jgi:dTDP-4-dehydrorhamnose reductase
VADEGHPLWRWLTVRAGVPAPVLADLAERPSPPDLLGVHHYPPSDRFLDERMERYPAWSHGGNAERRYADVELIRVLGDERNGLREAVLETSERYAAPIAMTEVHIGGTRTDQLAWWWSAVRAADELRARGHDVRAVTAWAAFGSFDWPSLLTRADGWYEPGLFDARVRLVAARGARPVSAREPRRPGHRSSRAARGLTR